MLTRLVFVSALALNFLLLSINGGETPPEVPNPIAGAVAQEAPLVSKYGPRDVEVMLVDNSLFRGSLSNVDSLTLKTAYGVLTIPCGEILRIQRGTRISEKILQDFDDSIHALDHDEFAKRNAAQIKLEGADISAIEPLKKARDTASPEARARIEKILAKLSDKLQGRTLQTEDMVRTTRFECTGILQLDKLQLASRVGQLSIKLDDLQSIRWLNRGETRAMTIEPTPAMGDWLDTGVTLNNGDLVAVTATGIINPSPNNNNLDIGPIGTENWGNQNPFLMGALLGKVGSDGETFLIGAGRSWTATTKDKLFVKVFWNNRQCRIEPTAKGNYKLKIATGTLAESLKIPKGGQESSGDAEENNSLKN